MRRTTIIGLALLIAPREGYASTWLIDFDHVARAVYTAPYKAMGGLVWRNFGIAAASYTLLPRGLNEAVVSTPNVAYNLDQSVAATISGPSFGFIDAWFSSWMDDSLEISVLGIDRLGRAKYCSQFVVDTLGPALHRFDWSNIVAVSMISRSAIGERHFSIDDIRLSVAVTEPYGLLLVGVALLCCGRARLGSKKTGL